MRRAATVLLLSILLAGCSGGDDGGGPSATSSSTAVAGERELARQAFTTGTGETDSVAFTLDREATLRLAIDFGPSSFSGFEFGGVDACEGSGPGAGVFPNSSQWSDTCGPVPAGAHTLTWTVEAGNAQGTLTVRA